MTINSKYKKMLRVVVDQIGSKQTNNIQLNEYGVEHIKKFQGVYMQDDKIKLKQGQEANIIINTDTQGMPGTHWVAVHKSKNDIWYIYDSFGRKSKKLLPLFIRKKQYVDSDYDAEQKDYEDNCGARCLAWLLYIQKYGIREALKI